MNESENNFESLRRLLALKRHEIPPPCFFDGLPDVVISRIRAGEADEPREMADRVFAQAPWLLKFLQVFEAKPVYAGSFACALCLLLLLGIVYAERPDVAPKATLLAAATQSAGPFTDVTSAILSPSSGQTGLMISTNPVLNLEPVASLFGQQSPLAQPGNSLVQPVSFSIPGN
jgi:hypothetical protein